MNERILNGVIIDVSRGQDTGREHRLAYLRRLIAKGLSVVSHKKTPSCKCQHVEALFDLKFSLEQAAAITDSISVMEVSEHVTSQNKLNAMRPAVFSAPLVEFVTIFKRNCIAPCNFRKDFAPLVSTDQRRSESVDLPLQFLIDDPRIIFLRQCSVHGRAPSG